MSNETPLILLAEDGKSEQMIYKSYLERSGFCVETAEDGEIALEKAYKLRPDLIVLDYIMPKKDGLEVMDTIRHDPDPVFASTLIFMYTSEPDCERLVLGLSRGADEYLIKPIQRKEFVARISSLIRIKRLSEELNKRNKLLRVILSRYLASELVESLLQSPENALDLGGTTRTVTVSYADIRKFTLFSEKRHPAEVANTLNRIFELLVPIILENKGTFDKYLGDAVLSFFGAPKSYPDDAFRAVFTALKMQAAFKQLRDSSPDLSELGLGVALVTGEALVGNLGCEHIMDYTVIGDVPNVCQRLQEHSLDGQVLICAETYRQTKDYLIVEPLEAISLRHRTQKLQGYNVLGLKDNYLEQANLL